MRSKDEPPARSTPAPSPADRCRTRTSHQWTIADAIAQGRPALVAFATPVYCTSQFCGPVVDAVEKLSRRYADRAVFIHVEIYHDYGQRDQPGGGRLAVPQRRHAGAVALPDRRRRQDRRSLGRAVEPRRGRRRAAGPPADGLTRLLPVRWPPCPPTPRCPRRPASSTATATRRSRPACTARAAGSRSARRA